MIGIHKLTFNNSDPSTGPEENRGADRRREMESSLSQPFVDLRNNVLQLEARVNLLLNWISHKFAEDTSLPRELLCSIFEAELAVDDQDDFSIGNSSSSSALILKDECTPQTIDTLRPRDRRPRKQQISTLIDFDFEKIPLDPVKEEEVCHETELIRVVDMRSILNPTESQLPHSLPRTRQAFVCTVCNRKFRSSAFLETHKMTHCFVKLTSLDSAKAKASQCKEPEELMEARSSPSSDLDDPDFHLEISENDLDLELVSSASSDDDDARENSSIEVRRSRAKPDQGDFVCSECQRKFAKYRYLMAHMKLHHRKVYQEQLTCQNRPRIRAMRNSGEYSCSVCHRRFARNRYLSAHMRHQHREAYLQELASQNKPLVPKAKPNMGDFVCGVCQKKFARERYLRDHTRLVHRELYLQELEKRGTNKLFSNRVPIPRGKRNVGDFDCSVCSRKFAHEKSLRSHMRRNHREILEQQLMSQNKVLETRAKRNVGDFICTLCQRKYAQERYLRDHMRIRHPDLHEQWLEERRSKSTTKYPCSICQEIFHSKHSFQQHRLIFHREHLTPNELNMATIAADDLKCDICLDGKQFTSPRLLRRHKKEVHPIQHKCAECNATFVARSGLEHHNLAVHLKLKPFVCDICGNSFSKNAGLKIHQQIHSETRQYSCKYCSKSFKQKPGLDMHMKRHFKSKHQVQCFQCGQLFGSTSILKNHRRRVHEGLRPHACTQCSKRFKEKTHLNYHLKTHSNPNGRTRGLNKEREPIVRRQPASRQVASIPEEVLLAADPISEVTDANISSHQHASGSEAFSEPLGFHNPDLGNSVTEELEVSTVQQWVLYE